MSEISESIERLLGALRAAQHPLGSMVFDPDDRVSDSRFVELTGAPIPGELAGLWDWWGGQWVADREGYGDRLPGFLKVASLDFGLQLRDELRDAELNNDIEFVPGWFGSGNWLPIMWEQHSIVWADLSAVDEDGRVPLEYRLTFLNELFATFSSIAELINSMSYLLEEGHWTLTEYGWGVPDTVPGHEWVYL